MARVEGIYLVVTDEGVSVITDEGVSTTPHPPPLTQEQLDRLFGPAVSVEWEINFE